MVVVQIEVGATREAERSLGLHELGLDTESRWLLLLLLIVEEDEEEEDDEMNLLSENGWRSKRGSVETARVACCGRGGVEGDKGRGARVLQAVETKFRFGNSGLTEPEQKMILHLY